MSEFLILRHAPTDWNRAGRIQGRADRALSPEGRAEAATWRLPEWARDWPCLSSPLRRALETGRAMGLDPSPRAALAEMDWGVLEGRTLEAVRREGGDAFAAEEAKGLDFRPPGGESPREVGARVAAFLAAEGRDAVVVAHKGVLRALFALATGWDMRSKPPLRIHGASAHRFAVPPDGRPVLLSANIPLAEAAGAVATKPLPFSASHSP